MAPSAILQLKSLSKFFGAFCALDEVSVGFAPGQVHAVMGENGAGKSTLMKIIFGLLRPDGGELSLASERLVFRSPLDAIAKKIGMVQQHFALVENLTVLDNIILGAEPGKFGLIDRPAAQRALEANLAFAHLKLPWNELVENISIGQKQKVEILKLLYRQADILILDEPTAVLTPAEIEEFFGLLRALRAQGKTIILITHKIPEVFAVCDTYCVLRKGRLVGSGLISDIQPEALVELMIGRKPKGVSEQQYAPKSAATADVVLDCQDLREAGSKRGGLHGVNLRVYAGEIVGLAGVEGSGQSNLVDVLMGLRKAQGELRFLGKPILGCSTREIRDLGFGLVPEDRLSQGLWREQSCEKNMIIGLEDAFCEHGLLKHHVVADTALKWAQKFDVRAGTLTQSAGSLSGGNQQKIIFAREILGRKPKMLICHQPTRGVDLGAIEHIHEEIRVLRRNGTSSLIISSELDELLTLCDRIYAICEGQITGEWRRVEFDRFKIGAAMTGGHA